MMIAKSNGYLPALMVLPSAFRTASCIVGELPIILPRGKGVIPTLELLELLELANWFGTH
jgi:hypothetical protein